MQQKGAPAAKKNSFESVDPGEGATKSGYLRPLTSDRTELVRVFQLVAIVQIVAFAKTRGLHTANFSCTGLAARKYARLAVHYPIRGDWS